MADDRGHTTPQIVVSPAPSSRKGKSRRNQKLLQNPADGSNSAKAPRAHWTDQDVRKLVDFLLEKKATTPGSGFKGAIWTEAEAAFSKYVPAKGGPKTASACSGKWAKVCCSAYYSYSAPHANGSYQLKEDYESVQPLTRLSGLPWSSTDGLQLDENSEPVWQDYIKVTSCSCSRSLFLTLPVCRNTPKQHVSPMAGISITTCSN